MIDINNDVGKSEELHHRSCEEFSRRVDVCPHADSKHTSLDRSHVAKKEKIVRLKVFSRKITFGPSLNEDAEASQSIRSAKLEWKPDERELEILSTPFQVNSRNFHFIVNLQIEFLGNWLREKGWDEDELETTCCHRNIQPWMADCWDEFIKGVNSTLKLPKSPFQASPNQFSCQTQPRRVIRRRKFQPTHIKNIDRRQR